MLNVSDLKHAIIPGMKTKLALACAIALVAAVSACGGNDAAAPSGSSHQSAAGRITPSTTTDLPVVTTVATPSSRKPLVTTSSPPIEIDPEDLFIATVQIRGDIPIQDKEGAIKFGKAVCAELDGGRSFLAIGVDSAKAGAGVFTPTQVTYIMGAAIPAFCPEHRGKIPK